MYEVDKVVFLSHYCSAFVLSQQNPSVWQCFILWGNGQCAWVSSVAADEISSSVHRSLFTVWLASWDTRIELERLIHMNDICTWMQIHFSKAIKTVNGCEVIGTLYAQAVYLRPSSSDNQLYRSKNQAASQPMIATSIKMCCYVVTCSSFRIITASKD